MSGNHLDEGKAMNVGELSSTLLERNSQGGHAASRKDVEGVQSNAVRAEMPDEKDAQSGSPSTQGVGKEQAEKLVEELKRRLGVHAVDFKFKVHEDSGQLQVEVLDAASEKVVRKIPPDEILNFKLPLDEKGGAFLDRMF